MADIPVEQRFLYYRSRGITDDIRDWQNSTDSGAVVDDDERLRLLQWFQRRERRIIAEVLKNARLNLKIEALEARMPEAETAASHAASDARRALRLAREGQFSEDALHLDLYAHLALRNSHVLIRKAEYLKWKRDQWRTTYNSSNRKAANSIRRMRDWVAYVDSKWGSQDPIGQLIRGVLARLEACMRR